jgi:hypothetical protein
MYQIKMLIIKHENLNKMTKYLGQTIHTIVETLKAKTHLNTYFEVIIMLIKIIIENGISLNLCYVF